MKFTNTELMKEVKKQLILDHNESQLTRIPYVDPMFGDFFMDILSWTDEVVPRFSCEGHFKYVVPTGKGRECREAKMINGELAEDYAFAHYTSDPYICFLCTDKGFELVRTFYRELVKRSIEKGFNPTVYQLTESVYYDKNNLDDIDAQTGRITLRILPYYDEYFNDHHQEVIELIKTTFFWACPLFKD